MIYPVEKLYSKAATRKELKISRARYEQFIEAGILAKPFAIVEGGRPLHTESQIRMATANLYERANRAHLEQQKRNRMHGYKPTKPIALKPGESHRTR